MLLREERIVSLVPQTRPEPTLLKVHQLCDGLFLPAWGMCVRKSGGKSVPWLCASPESATFGSPVSDRQTQRQAQAGGGGWRAGGGGDLRVGRLQGQGRRERGNPIPAEQQRSRGQISNSPIQISLLAVLFSLVFYLCFSMSLFSASSF